MTKKRIPRVVHNSFEGVVTSEIIDTFGVTITLGLFGSRYGMANVEGERRILKMTIMKQMSGISTKNVEPR